MNGVQAFARWYNSLPQREMTGPMDLSRGPTITVDRALTPEKQTALRRFAARASDQLSSLQQTTIVQPAPPATPAVKEFPWLGLIGASIGAVTLVAFLSYAESHQKRRPAGA